MNDLKKTVLALHAISKQYFKASTKIDVLRAVNLDIRESDFIALLGPSGSGKTSLLNIIGAVESPSAGDLILRGTKLDLNDNHQLRLYRQTELGFVFQHFHLLEHLTAIENAILPALLIGQSWNQAYNTAARIFKQLSITHLTDSLPSEMSGGEMQRVAIVRASIHKPALILADEPTGSLDAESASIVLSMLLELSKQGTAIIMATHNLASLNNCNRVYQLKAGELSEFDKSNTL